MDFISSVAKIMPLIVSVLKTDLKSRDDDNYLILAIWNIQTKGKITSYDDFTYLLLNGDLAVPATIIRSRRRLQQKYNELRGQLYYERQHADRVIRNQIRLNFDIENGNN